MLTAVSPARPPLFSVSEAGLHTLVFIEPPPGNPHSESCIHGTRVLEPSTPAVGTARLLHSSSGTLGRPPPLSEPPSPCLEVGVRAGQDCGWRLALGPVRALSCVPGRQGLWLLSSPPGGVSPSSDPERWFGDQGRGRPIEASPWVSCYSLLKPSLIVGLCSGSVSPSVRGSWHVSQSCLG